MKDFLTIFPIDGLGHHWDEDYLDPSTFLPFQILPDLAVEDLTLVMTDRTFAFLQSSPSLSQKQVNDLKQVKYGIVHRFHADTFDEALKKKSRDIVEQSMACLRLIRPTREHASLMTGYIEDGRMVIEEVSVLHEMIEVPEVQKLNHIRQSDLEDLRAVVPRFLQAFSDSDSCWRVRIATQFHQGGHFASGGLWKSRYILWASALEAIYTSDDPEHKGNKVLISRVKFFLGESTRIYTKEEFKYAGITPPSLTVGSTIADCQKIRNLIAHGSKIDDRWFDREGRSGLNGKVNYIEVLMESLSFMARKSILRVVSDDALLTAFTLKQGASRYFASQGLVRSKLP